MICKILHIFYDIRLEQRVANQLLLFKEAIEGRKLEDKYKPDQKFNPQLVPVSPSYWSEIKVNDPNNLEQTFRSGGSSISLDVYLHKVLLDLSLYEYPPLATSALALLFRHMKPHDELLYTLSKVQLLVEDEDVKMYNKAQIELLKLRNILKDNDISEEEVSDVSESLRIFIKMCTVSDGINLLFFFFFHFSFFF